MVVLLNSSPTVQTLRGLVAATPWRLPPKPGTLAAGLGTTLQLAPFQCSVSGRTNWLGPVFCKSPTAQTLLGARLVTPKNSVSAEPKLTAGVRLPPPPSQPSPRVRLLPPG